MISPDLLQYKVETDVRIVFFCFFFNDDFNALDILYCVLPNRVSLSAICYEHENFILHRVKIKISSNSDSKRLFRVHCT